jgi:3'(2'), 5'-bisphosphate nucleotidase
MKLYHACSFTMGLFIPIKSTVAFAALSTNADKLATAIFDFNELPHDLPRRKDVLVALESVRKACKVTTALQPSNVAASIGTVEKADQSPVTVADYAVQALILHHIQSTLKDKDFIAEEDSATLQKDDNLCQQVMQAASLSRAETLRSIDLGKSYVNSTGTSPSRVWCLDPIDGTRGFLRGKHEGGQYAVALSLIENGVPTIGVLGCPNLPKAVDDEDYAWRKDEDETNNQDSRGCIFVASRGGGCYQLPIVPKEGVMARRIQATSGDASTRAVKDARFCIGVEKYSDALGHT